MDKPVNPPVKFVYSMCSCKVPIQQLKTKESIKKNCDCGIKQLK